MRVPRPLYPARKVHRNNTTHTRAPACPQATARPAWVNGWPVSGCWLADEGPEAMSAGRSGLPVPRRRTFAAPILGFAHSEETALRHPWLRWFPRPARGARATPTIERGYSARGSAHVPSVRLCVAFDPPGTQRGAASRGVPSASPRLDAHARRQGRPTAQAARHRPPGWRPAGRRPGKASRARDGREAAEVRTNRC